MLEIYTTDEQCFSFSPKDLFSNITIGKTNISMTLLKNILVSVSNMQTNTNY